MKLHELRSWCNRASFADDKEIEIYVECSDSADNLSDSVADRVLGISSIDINKDAIRVFTAFKRYD